jgi:methyltransferase-like protein/trans-aconitate methyltransferase
MSEKLAAPAQVAPSLVANSYDEMPYTSYPYAQTHPSRLAVIATLFGMHPPAVEKCRVLELGCASGGNLIPMAEMLPGSAFVGVDLSGRQIADGQRVVDAIGLPNITLRHASILDVDESYGPFDYVICHGVFSWVPDAVREKILDVCAKHLTLQGVAYVSYNTYPGWHMRGMIRDMMRYHALRFSGAPTQVKQARALLDFLAQSAPQNGGAFATLLRSELEDLRTRADHYLYHEHLEAVNDPLYFHQFADQAARHGLRYLGEARLTTMVPANFGPEVQKGLGVVARDQVQAEQYMDFVRNRMFRETLLVRADAELDWGIEPEAVRGLHVTTPRRFPEPEGDVRSDVVARYQTKSGLTASTSSPVLKAAMQVLSWRWPATVSFPELEAAVAAVIGQTPAGPQALAVALLNTYVASDVIELHAMPVRAVTPGERPVALRSVRAQLAAGRSTVANRRHEQMQPGDLERRLIPLLDGTRDRAALVGELTTLTLAGELTVKQDGQPVTDPAAVREAMGPVLERSLEALADASLLAG